MKNISRRKFAKISIATLSLPIISTATANASSPSLSLEEELEFIKSQISQGKSFLVPIQQLHDASAIARQEKYFNSLSSVIKRQNNELLLESQSQKLTWQKNQRISLQGKIEASATPYQVRDKNGRIYSYTHSGVKYLQITDAQAVSPGAYSGGRVLYNPPGGGVAQLWTVWRAGTSAWFQMPTYNWTQVPATFYPRVIAVERSSAW